MLETPNTINNKKKKGCFFYGCLSIIIIVCLVLGLIGYELYKIYPTVKGATSFISNTQMTVASQSLTPAQNSDLKYELKKQIRNLDAGVEANITLTPEELSQLIINDLKSIGNAPFEFSVATKFSDNLIISDLSIKIEENIFLNGSITLENTVDKDNNPQLIVKSIANDGTKEIPQELKDKIINRDILPDITALILLENKMNTFFIIKSIKIENNKLTAVIMPMV